MALMPLDELGDACQVRLIACDPALDAETAGKLLGALEKLFVQFQREDQVEHWSFAVLASGAVVITAWQGRDRLSGCAQDRLGRLFLAYENQHRRTLSASGLLIEDPASASDAASARVRLRQRGELKELIARDQLDGRSHYWDLTVENLGQWRRDGRRPLVETALGARLLRNAG